MIHATSSASAEWARNDARGGLPLPTAVALVAAAGLVFGGLTQLGQSYLPEWLGSLANSGAPWVLVAVGLSLVSHTPWAACACGVTALAGMEIGYVIVAAVRGFPSAGTTVAFWLTAAVAFGPVAGLAGYFLLMRKAPWDALGAGLVAGIVSGEGLVSYLTVRDTTTPAYWIGQMILGLVLVALVGRRTDFGWAVLAFAVGIGALAATRLVPMLGAY
jgi:hypothetical protein